MCLIYLVSVFFLLFLNFDVVMLHKISALSTKKINLLWNEPWFSHPESN